MSSIMKTKVTKAVNKNLKFCHFTVLSKTNKFKNYFHLKDLVPETLCSTLREEMFARTNFRESTLRDKFCGIYSQNSRFEDKFRGIYFSHFNFNF